MQHKTQSQRILLVDGLRGIALLGIIIAHTLGWFIAGFIPEKIWQVYAQDVPSTVVSYFDGIFISGKFFTFFSFLFGLSFSLQFSQRKADDAYFSLRFLWRLVILFLIGFVHHLHWRGDILGIYAFLGVFLLLINALNNQWVSILAMALMLNTPILCRNLYALYQPQVSTASQISNDANNDTKAQEKNFYTLKQGSYTAIIQQNFKDFAFKADFQWNSGRIFVTLGFFLLGLLAGRRKIFEQFETFKPLFKKGFWLVFTINLSIIMLFFSIQALVPQDQLPRWFPAFGELLFSLHTVCMTLMYIVGFALLLYQARWARLLRSLSYIGKMALTNYLLQSAIGIGIFYGVGLGLAGDFSPAWCLVLAIVLFMGQILLSKWWLQHFYYGPVEWLWRSATYFSWQKMRR